MLDDLAVPSSPRSSLTGALNAEWARVATDPASVAQMAAWELPEPGLAHPERLLAAVGRQGDLDTTAADTLLAHVVRLARDDDLATRLVLQRVLGPLVLVAVRRTRSRPADRQTLFDDLVATAWLVIRSYPLDRRPAKVAANIVRDAEYLTCVRPARLRSASEIPSAIPPGALGVCRIDGRSPSRLDPGDEIAELLAAGLASGLDRRDLAMVAEVHLLGRSVEAVARRYHITSRTVRNRRLAVTRQLAALVA
jgi:hypothetical protein